MTVAGVEYRRVPVVRLREVWADDRLTVAQAAAACGLSEVGLRNRARRLGFPARRLGPKPHFSDTDFRALWVAGVSLREVAALFGVDRTTLSCAARRLALVPRGSGWQPKMTLAQFQEAQLAERMLAVARGEAAARREAALQARRRGESGVAHGAGR